MTPPTIDVTTILEWIKLHQWVPLIAFLGGLGVRLVKADTKLPSELPAWMRPYLAVVLSIAAMSFLALGNGIPWQSVIEQGLMAAVLAILGHETIIEGARGGIEIPVPFLTKEPVPIVADEAEKTAKLPPSSDDPSPKA